ncbi:MAG TPA: plasmid pRiA4b ORF-3 family protein [Steroidobacter sp.]|uniref:plasmid pRiA4b ORF-3 family protein n=1 Tax=Steroidobacter sp. TaxID=1978227 RepID=UPI002ED813F7
MPSQSKATLVALRVELLDIEPLIWRRIVVSNQGTFAALHNYLQWVMGWQDSHAHEFRAGDQCIAPDWWIQEVGMDSDVTSYKDERRTSISAVVREGLSVSDSIG